MKPSSSNSLISIDGKPLINHPGLVFPKHVIQVRSGFCTKTGRAYTREPQDGINTRQVANLLSCSMSGARQYLHRKKVKFVLIRRENGALECFWDKKAVMRIMGKRTPVVGRIPKSYLTTQEAMEALGMARSALYRLAKKGDIIERKIRVRTPKGVRIRCYYHEGSIKKILALKKKTG